MTFIIANLCLTLVWAAVTGSFSPHNLVLGFAVGALSLALVRERLVAAFPAVRLLKLLLLTVVFFRELWLSAFKVAVVAVRRDMQLRPGIFAYPLALTRDFEITLLANMITLTPGTLSVDVSDDRKTLYVHALDCRDPAAERRGISTGFERLIREAFPL
ncbi:MULTISPECIES: Na+/H+ antiporter subunit E [unclassified Rhizobium]|uniref:Na+/H+ antiporter subunit E n=1 Tax=unclassified Rhizobium TaxID=2613769 RepID=UPI0007136AD9|nr:MULTISPECIES: Na+/H+ antiporter subunit E [unclassified Rhizobium]KQS96462.1 cation:proton antiporter [Rhizobium sp. Leaf386]KQT06301.1 cation:proton antiporter [Rhizobium sp. Leaf391]KQU09464.1 cation:proton antiporter [Rhizobium sp. Leaf453]